VSLRYREVKTETLTKRFRQGRWLFAVALAAFLRGSPPLRAFSFQEQAKPEKSEAQPESDKQTEGKQTDAKQTDGKQTKDKQSKKESAEAANALPAVLWRDPGAIASLDLLNGEGGAKDAPDPHAEYTFIKEDLNGTSPKFYVQDSNGVKWLVKLGVEARPETAASRLVWAAGYYTDEDYFLPQIHVNGLPKLHRKMFGASPQTGIAPNVRLKREGEGFKKIENWDWFDNPFAGKRELNGLRALMALMNNWDLTTKNNKVYVADNERHFLVSDLGASFGKTQWPPSRVPLLPHATKGSLKDYEHSKFMRAVKGETVTFEMHTTAPFFIREFNHTYFNEYKEAERVERGIPIADAQWVGHLLAQLTPQQIRDAFRAAGYRPDEVDGFAKVVEKRIAALNQLKE
jgi:hypothetical protein